MPGLAPAPTSYKLPAPKDPLDTAKLNLSEDQFKKLVNLGLNSGSRLRASLPLAMEAFAEYLDMTVERLQQLRADLIELHGKGFTKKRTEELRELKTPYGLLDEEPLLGKGKRESNFEALTGKGYALTETAKNGFDFRNDAIPIRHQGERNTCVAFSVLRCVEYCRHGNNEGTPFDLSEQYLYWHMKAVDGHPGRSGSTITAGLQQISGLGSCLEASCPYEATAADEEEKGTEPQPAEDLRNEASGHRLDLSNCIERVAPKDVEGLKVLLANKIPIAFGMAVFKSVMESDPVKNDGLLHLPPTTEEDDGAHAVMLVGYGVDDAVPGGGYFVFDNSWGTQWAHNNKAFGAGRGIVPFAYVSLHGNRAAAIRL